MSGVGDASPRAVQESKESAPPAPTPPRPPQAGVSVIDSAALFGGASEVRVRHGGDEYRLRITRQGKLILTK